MAQKQSFEQPMLPESCWIKYQLDLRNIKYDEVAKEAHRTTALVSMVICRKRNSKIVEATLAKLLGYPSWERLLAAAIVRAERRAV
jgi:hypothetical protein